MEDRIQKAAQRLAQRAEELRKSKKDARKPSNVIQLPARPAPSMDGIERDSRIRWIRAMRRYYKPVGMDLIVQQALIGKSQLEDLSDDEILQLHRDIDRARECLADGVTFEDAGLLRSHGEVA